MTLGESRWPGPGQGEWPPALGSPGMDPWASPHATTCAPASVPRFFSPGGRICRMSCVYPAAFVALLRPEGFPIAFHRPMAERAFRFRTERSRTPGVSSSLALLNGNSTGTSASTSVAFRSSWRRSCMTPIGR